MIQSRRAAFLFGTAALLLTLLFLLSTHSPSWQSMPQVVGLGDLVPDEEEIGQRKDMANDAILKLTSDSNSIGEEISSKVDPLASLFVPGQAKAPGSNYTRALVVARTKGEAADWIENTDLGDVKRMAYVVDNSSAPLHPPMNKGHEVMVYLTYIIDHYDDLPDVSIFMHAHQYSWHQNDLLSFNAEEMVQRLSSERVQREGYMNLRCHWMPGCPEWMRPGTLEKDPYKQEETLMAEAWAEIFPDKPIPEILAQPCCAQFALSGQRIRATPREKYEFYRQWLMRTKMEDKISGRVWEYLWQVVFTGEAKFCPNQFSCYCDGYGVCFESEKMFDYWFELRYKKKNSEAELDEWRKKAEKVEEYRKEGKLVDVEGIELEIPIAGKDVELMAEISKLDQIMENGKRNAIDRGRDPQVRAKSAGRRWTPGDGY